MSKKMAVSGRLKFIINLKCIKQVIKLPLLMMKIIFQPSITQDMTSLNTTHLQEETRI
jgi:hypothetical protein